MELKDPGECVVAEGHRWEYFVADTTTPYYFCRNCKKTLFNGRVYGLRS